MISDRGKVLVGIIGGGRAGNSKFFLPENQSHSFRSSESPSLPHFRLGCQPLHRTSQIDDSRPLGSRSPSPRVRPDLPPQEERQPCLRWFPLRWLRQGPHCPRLPDRGAEDRQEGSQGVPGEGCWQALSNVCFRRCWSFEERTIWKNGMVLLESKKRMNRNR